MSLTSSVIAALYRLSGSVSFQASALLPTSMHPGKRACAALRHWWRRRMGRTSHGPCSNRGGDPDRCSRILLSLSRSDVRRFLEERAEFEGAIPSAALFDLTRPVILAAPHYGAAPVGYLAALRHFGTRRPVNLFFDTSRSDATHQSPVRARRRRRHHLLGGFSGVISAMRALDRKECLIMMPDAYRRCTARHSPSRFSAACCG